MIELGENRIGTPAICASVIGNSLESMEDGSERALVQGADVLEIRLDKLKQSKGWKDLLKKEIPVIATNRSQKEGGHFEGKERERIEILREAMENGADCIDIELSAEEGARNRIVEEAGKKGIATIMSFHDFDKVPRIKTMIEKAERMEDFGCDMAKIIGFANEADESIRMLDFLIRSSKEVEIPVIAFAMGKEGRFTRVASSLLGSPITYASVEEKAAPGQIDLPTMKKVLDNFRK